MAVYSEVQMPRFKEEDLPGTTKKLYNVVRELQEMLQFVLSNLDGDNIEGYEEIFNRLEGADGAISILKQTADEITAQVRKGTEQIAELTVKADGITQRVSDNEQGIAELKVTAAGISQRVADTEGNLSSLQQTANGLTSRVSSAEGNISSIQQTANGLSSRVSSAEGSISSFQQTANGLSSTVSDLSGKYTRIEQKVNEINLTGVVTFSALETSGETEINGDNITSGEIEARYLRLYGPMEVYETSRNSSDLGGYIGFVEGSAYNDNGSVRTTEGIGVKAPGLGGFDGGMVVCTDSGARLTFGKDMFGKTTTIACVSQHCYSSEQMETFSDMRLKQDIYYDIAEKYGAFFRALRPCRFVMKQDAGGAFQIGFIAQEVKRALEENGLCMDDFHALTQFQSEEPDEEGIYSLRYGEFAALNTAMVQSLLARVDALENRIAALEGGETI